MTIEEMILDKLQSLPVEKQREVLDFVEFLLHKTTPKSTARVAGGTKEPNDRRKVGTDYLEP